MGNIQKNTNSPKRATKDVVEGRLNIIEKMMFKWGATTKPSQIIEFIRSNGSGMEGSWDEVSDEMMYKYIAKVRDRIGDITEYNRAYLIGQSANALIEIAKYGMKDDIHAEGYKKNSIHNRKMDPNLALSATKEMNKLLGLYAPQKTEHTVKATTMNFNWESVPDETLMTLMKAMTDGDLKDNISDFEDVEEV